MRPKYKFIQDLKEKRVFKVIDQADGRYYIIKKPRSEGSEYESISLINEPVCFLLGNKLEVPVAETQLITLRNKVWLRRPWFEKNICEWLESVEPETFIPDSRYNCTHFWTVKEPNVDRLQKSGLKEILAFDQWVWALDRVPHNVMINKNQGVKAIDYEHSLNLGTRPSSPYSQHYRQLSQVPVSTKTCHPTQMSHGGSTPLQIRGIVNRIESLDRNEIKYLVFKATDEVLGWQHKMGKKVDQKIVRSNSIIIIKLLLMRLRNLSYLIDDLFDGWRKVVEKNKCKF